MFVVLGGLVIAWIIGFGTRASLLAGQERRSRERWFVFGAALGPLALVILRSAPPGMCGICLAPVEGWDFRCSACGSDTRDRPALVRDRLDPVTTPTVVDLRALAGVARPALPVTPAVPAPPAVAPASARTETAAEVGRRPSTSRATAGVARAPRPVTGGDGASLITTATFVEGSEPMTPGARYALRIHRGELRVAGPVDARPDHIVVSRRLRDVATTALGDRLIISGATRRLDDFYLVLTSIEGRTAQVLAAELDEARRAAAASSPRTR